MSKRKADMQKSAVPEDWLIVEFVSNGMIVSVPEFWVRVEETEEIENSQAFCLWTDKLSHAEITEMAMARIKPKKTWKFYDVEILASAETLPELFVKQRMAANKVTGIDAVYNAEESKRNRKMLKMKKLDDGFTSGGGLSSVEGVEKENTELYSEIEEPEAPDTIFDSGIITKHSFEHQPIQTSSTANNFDQENFNSEGEPQRDAGGLDLSFNQYYGNNEDQERQNEMEKMEQHTDPLIDEHEKTWHIIQLNQTKKWHVVPSFWIDFEKYTCSYPPPDTNKVNKNYIKNRREPDNDWQILEIHEMKPVVLDNCQSARSICRAAREDEKENFEQIENPTSENQMNKESDVVNPKPSKPVISGDRRTPSGRKITFKRASLTLTDTELEKLEVKDMFKIIIRQNEESLRLQNQILVELKSGYPARTSEVLSTIQPARNLFPIKKFVKLNEIEYQLQLEQENLESGGKLPADNMTDKVLNFFNAQGGESGHKCLVAMIKNSISNKLQKAFSMQGKGTHNKSAFDQLNLWRLMKDVAVKKYLDVDNYTSAKADKSCAEWLKGAPERVRRDEDDRKKLKKKNDKLQKLAEEEAKQAEESDI